MRSFLVFGVASAACAWGSLAWAAGNLPVREVTIFKDGHALVLRSGTAATNGEGGVVLDELPRPILGAFWPYSDEPGARLMAVTAGTAKREFDRNATSIADLLLANIARRVRLSMVTGNDLVGVVVSVLHAPQGDPIVVITTDDGQTALPASQIKRVSAASGDDPDLALTLATTAEHNILTLDLDWEGDPAPEAAVGFMYVQRGLRWIPNYRITLDGDDAYYAGVRVDGRAGTRGEKKRQRRKRRRGGLLPDQTIFVETRQSKRFYQGRSPPSHNEFCHILSGHRPGFEAVGAPTDIHQESAHPRHFAHNRTIVRGHVAQAGPLAQQPQLRQRVEPLRLEHRLRKAIDPGQAVERRPLPARTAPAGRDRALQVLVETKQVMSVTAHGRRILLQQRTKH